ncbi:MAG TPA: SAM-dependent methyltransferase [Candidatus Nanoarchaeia archaeon]|nr:SAM-dependent methyltransferase [Candidatus Nanoarchaeia archaeon]
MPVFIVEHLEQKLWPWCKIEYSHISRIVGKKNVWFTNVCGRALVSYGKVMSTSVIELHRHGKIKNVCVFDPAARKTLTPADAKKFDYFVFGGILGDDPPQQRTAPELTDRMSGVSVRNIGTKQMSTDTAVYVVQEILHGKKISELCFQDGLEISLGKNESTLLPYRYLLVRGKPMISRELVSYIKKRKGL